VRIKKALPKPTRGGKREGAGRPPAHNVQLLLRLKETTADRLRELAEKTNQTPGQWLDQCLGAVGSRLSAQLLAILRKDLDERRRFSLKTAHDFKGTDPKQEAHFTSMADGIKDALRMVDELLEDK
jgi:hypothetical protein